MDRKPLSDSSSLPMQGLSSAPGRLLAWGGLFRRRECWTLSRRGWMLVLVLTVALLATIRNGAYPFLTVTQRVPADLLVVEGWSPPSTMRQAATEFLQGGYRQMVLIRPVLETGDQYESGRYSGDYMTRMLIADGVPSEKLSTLFPNVARKDRTFHSALSVKQWAEQRGINIKSLDVATLGPHSRRSRLMYEKAFGDGTTVGVIALVSDEYDPRHWWRTSEGVREIIGETIAYGYARLFFIPPAALEAPEGPLLKVPQRFRWNRNAASGPVGCDARRFSVL